MMSPVTLYKGTTVVRVLLSEGSHILNTINDTA